MASVLRRAQEPGKARVVAIVAGQVVLAVRVVPAAQVAAVAVRVVAAVVVVAAAVRGAASGEVAAALAGAITSLLAFRY